MFAGTRDTRRSSKERRRVAADRRIGHEMAWFYEWDKAIAAVLIAASIIALFYGAPVMVVVEAWAIWLLMRAPHVVAVPVLAAGLVGHWFLWTRTGSPLLHVNVGGYVVAGWLFGVGLAIVLAYTAWTIYRTSPHVQTMRLARGDGDWISPVITHLIGAAGVLLAVAGAVLWQSA